MTEEVYKKKWNYWISARRTSSRSSRRPSTTRSTTSSCTVIEEKLGSPWSSEISRFNIRHNCEEKIGRRSRYYPRTYWQDTGIAKWNQLYDRFERFSGCWINPQWTFTRYQSTSVFPTSSDSWRNAKPFYRNAEPQRCAAKHLGHAWYIGQHLIHNNWIHGVPEEKNRFTHQQWKRARNNQDLRCQSGPSAKDSVIFSGGDSSKN